MELTPDLLDLIHRHLTHQLPPDEELAFRVRLSVDADLRAEVDTQRQIRAAYQTLRHKHLLASIQTELQATGQLWQPGNVPPPPPIQPPAAPPLQRTRRWYVPASFALAASLLLVMGVVWYYRPGTPSGPVGNVPDGPAVAQQPAPHVPARPSATSQPPAKPVTAPPVHLQQAPRYATLYRQYFKPTLRLDPVVIRDRFGASNVPGVDAPGVDAPAPANTLRTDTVAIRAAIRLLEQGQPRQAIRQLRPTLGCLLPDWQANARWFLALAYLRAEQPAEARPLLAQLARRSSGTRQPLYQTEAMSLLKALE
jgi:hypothetical protein